MNVLKLSFNVNECKPLEPGPDLFKDYSWLRNVRWEPPKTILAQVGRCRLTPG
jgi:hypothetical protein